VLPGTATFQEGTLVEAIRAWQRNMANKSLQVAAVAAAAAVVVVVVGVDF
jgi:hypothetical protein